MKLRGEGESKDSGWYALIRSHVLEVLYQNQINVNHDLFEKEKCTLFQESEDRLIVLYLPDIVPARIVFNIANYFDIPIEDFYKSGQSGIH